MLQAEILESRTDLLCLRSVSSFVLRFESLALPACKVGAGAMARLSIGARSLHYPKPCVQ